MARPLGLAVDGHLERPFFDDDDLFVGMPVGSMRNEARLERRDVAFKPRPAPAGGRLGDREFGPVEYCRVSLVLGENGYGGECEEREFHSQIIGYFNVARIAASATGAMIS